MSNAFPVWISKIGKARLVILLGVLAILALVAWWFLGWLWALGGLGFGAGAAIREAQKAHEEANEQAIHARKQAAEVSIEMIQARTREEIQQNSERLDHEDAEAARQRVLRVFELREKGSPDA